MGLVERLDNINKQQVLARLTVAKIHGFITIEDFFRLSSLLERIPYVDLKELGRYKEPYYDESGDSELLFATGALELNTIDTTDGGTNKYLLSRLGDHLLRWGFGVHLEMEHGKGTNVELPMMTQEDVEESWKDAMEKAISNGQIVGDLNNGQEMFEYDRYRGE